MVRLADLPADRCHVRQVSSIPCVPGGVTPAPLPLDQDPADFMRDFAKFADIASHIYFLTIRDAHFLVEPGLDGVVLVDGKVVLETQRFRIISNARRGLCQGNTLRPPPRVTGHFDAVFLGFDPGWVNYMHWLTLTLPRLAVADRYLPGDVPFVLPNVNNYATANRPPAISQSSVRESLALAGIGEGREVQTLRPGYYSARELILAHPDTWAQVGWLSHKPARDFFGRMAATAGDLAADGREGRRLFISRDRAANDRMPFAGAERQRLDDVFRKWRIETIHLETMSLHEQAALFRQAELVVAPHGAGLANIMFGGPSLKILELQKRLGPNREMRSMFFYMAALNGQSYSFLDGDREGVSSADVDAAIAHLLADHDH